MSVGTVKPSLAFLAGLVASAWMTAGVEAGGPHARRGTVIVPTAGRAVSPGPLGSGFVSTPYIFVRGNGTAGGGYSPLGQYGDATMVINGPLSAFRTTSAPVLTYTRGYDGRLNASPATSFSMPNQPALSPVVYPTQATNFYGPRRLLTPPWWQSGITWIDQN